MPESTYQILDDEDLSQFNRARGLQITYERDPELVYRLPDSELNLYSHDPSLDDLLHPFKPSGSFVIEAFLDGRRKFFSGRDEDFSSLDEQLMEFIENLSSSEYYKQINSPD